MSIRFASLAAVGLLAAGCHVGADAEDREAGAEVTRSYQVGAFDRLEVAGPYEVNVVTGGQGGVTAKGGENLLAETEVIVEGNVLKIQPRKKKGVRWNWRNGKAVFTVNAAALHGASIAGSGGVPSTRSRAISKAKSRAPATSRSARLPAAGSSSISPDRAVSKLPGKADAVDISIAGSGDINLGGLASRTADVSIAGSGNVRASASDSANVSIMGSGDVEISGGAKCKVSKAGSGNVRCG